MSETRVTEQQRQTIFLRARGLCEYCRSPQEYCPDPFAVEHIIPRAAEESNVDTNLALSCSGCNGHKHVKLQGLDPVSNQNSPLYHPRQQKWREHFEWSSDFTHMIGKTASGRATVIALQLNRPGLVNLRRVLFIVGRHPPEEPE